MAKTKISEYDATAANNTDIDSINIAEGMAPSNVNNAIRELMAHLKDMDAGTQALTSPQLTSADINGGTIDGVTIGGASAGAGTFTNLTATGIDVTGTVTADGLTVDGFSYLSGAQIRDSSNAARGYVQGDADGLLLATDGARNITFDTNALERMRIDSSGNVGIGTSSPVNVSGVPDLTVAGKFFTSDGTGTNPAHSFTGDQNTGIFRPAADTFAITTNGTERMRIDSSGRVKIGTTSNTPASAGTAGIVFGDNTAGTPATGVASFAASSSAPLLLTRLGSDGNVLGIADGTTTRGTLRVVSSNLAIQGNNNLVFSTGGSNSERMRIDSSGNVGIGNSTPSSYESGATNLVVGNTGDTGMTVASGTSSNGSIFFADGTSGGAKYEGQIRYNHASNFMMLVTGGTERMRIDSSGNLLVGKTASTVSTDGFEVINDGHLSFTRNNDTPVFLNRRTSDGSIIDFRKDNSTVGSIGVTAGRLTVGGGDTGLRFVQDYDEITPWNPSTNGVRDAAIDLGSSANRFKDLYLSGGVYLGGTGSANLLDDYEEGTWTPQLLTDAGSAAGKAYSVQNGVYTKIGQTVIATFDVGFDGTSGAKGSNNLNEAHVEGFPFAMKSSTPMYGFISAYSGTGVNINTIALLPVSAGLTKAYIAISSSAGTTTSLAIQTLYTDSTRLRGTAIYDAS